MLPIRVVVESLEGAVSWDATQKKVIISLNSKKIELWIGNNTAKVNGISKLIDSTNSKFVPEIIYSFVIRAPFKRINGRTMLPMRFVSEQLGTNVSWDNTTKTITITY